MVLNASTAATCWRFTPSLFATSTVPMPFSASLTALISSTVRSTRSRSFAHIFGENASYSDSSLRSTSSMIVLRFSRSLLKSIGSTSSFPCLPCFFMSSPCLPIASCSHDEKIQEYREAHETGKCGDFYLGQRNARISVGQIGRLDRNPVTLHGGLKISDASHQSLDTGACVQVLGTSVVVASVMSYP